MSHHCPPTNATESSIDAWTLKVAFAMQVHYSIEFGVAIKFARFYVAVHARTKRTKDEHRAMQHQVQGLQLEQLRLHEALHALHRENVMLQLQSEHVDFVVNLLLQPKMDIDLPTQAEVCEGFADAPGAHA